LTDYAELGYVKLPTEPFLVDNAEKFCRWLNDDFSLFEPLLKWVRHYQTCNDEKLRTAAIVELWVVFNLVRSGLFLVLVAEIPQRFVPGTKNFGLTLLILVYPLNIGRTSGTLPSVIAAKMSVSLLTIAESLPAALASRSVNSPTNPVTDR
jgi:hypothetical protein